MRITCPNCTAGFEIPTELLGRKGRSLKCATCGHSWFQAAVVDEIDLADVLAETKAAETASEMGGGGAKPASQPAKPIGGSSIPDTAAIAAIANEALGTTGGPVEKPPSDIPEGAKSLLGDRNTPQPAPIAGQSMLGEQGATGGPQAASLGGESMLGEGLEDVGDDAISWMEKEGADQPSSPQVSHEQGATGGPGSAPAKPTAPDPAAAQGQNAAAQGVGAEQGGAAGGPGSAPQGAAAPGGEAVSMMDQGGATGGPGAAPQKPGADDPVKDAPKEEPVSWLDRQANAEGMPGMPPAMAGMPGMPAAMPGMPGMPSAGGATAAPLSGQSMMSQGANAGPGAPAMSQLSGDHIAAPGMGSQSMLSGDQVTPPASADSMMGGTQGGPGAPGASQMGGDIDAPGDVARSMLDGEVQGGQGAQGGPPEEGASGGPGQSMLEDEAAGGGAQGGPESGGASGGPGQSMLEDDAAGGPGAEGGPESGGGASGGPGQGGGADLDEDPLDGAVTEDDDAFHQADRKPGEEGEDGEDGDGPAEDDDAFHQADRKPGEEGEEDEGLVDPDEDRPDFGGTGNPSGDDDLDDDSLAGTDEDVGKAGKQDKDKKKKKKKSKPLDPAYVTAAVLTIIAILIGSMLFLARDQLAEMWPGIEGVYEALNLDEDSAEGLRLSAPQPVRIMKAGVQTLVVSGFITNLTPEIQNVPNIKLMLVNKDNEVVQETSQPPNSPVIDPNSTMPYRIELQLPIETATSLRVDWD